MNGPQNIGLGGLPGACEELALGQVVATLIDDEFCIRMSYGPGFSDLPEPKSYSHIHGPAQVGEDAPVVFILSQSTIKTDCFKVKRKEKKQLLAGLWYINVHSAKCL